MKRPSWLDDTKSFLLQVASGVLVAALTSSQAIPNQELHLSSLALGFLSIPIFLALGYAAAALGSLYLLITVLDAVFVHLDWFDGPTDLF